MDESEENVFLLNSGAKSFHVPSCGILAGFFLRLACASSGRRDTGPSLTTTSGRPSLRFPSTSS